MYCDHTETGLIDCCLSLNHLHWKYRHVYIHVSFVCMCVCGGGAFLLLSMHPCMVTPPK